MLIILVIIRLYDLHKGEGDPILGYVPSIGPLKTMSPIPSTSARVVRRDSAPNAREAGGRPSHFGNR